MPFNEAAHTWLTTNGYEYKHYPCSFEDVGDAENGPELTGHPAFDEYKSDIEYVVIEENGDVYVETRDLDQERFEETMETQQNHCTCARFEGRAITCPIHFPI